MFRNQVFQRAVSSIVLLAFSTMITSPVIAATRTPAAHAAAPVLQNIEEQFAKLLSEMYEELQSSAPGAASRHFTAPAAPRNFGQLLASMRAKGALARGIMVAAEESFAETEAHLRRRGLGAEVLQRHAAVVGQFKARKSEFERLLTDIDNNAFGVAEQRVALNALTRFFERQISPRSHTLGNPARLPFGVKADKAREPFVQAEDFQASLFQPRYRSIMLAGAIPAGLTLSVAGLPNLPGGADLTAAEEVQLTSAIRDKAAELGKDPIRIYEWVRNNVGYTPTYGSVQGSEATLRSMRGNAFDTASLLIALYRASGIPARYAYGTIEVPADRLKNWLGGVATTEAALQMLGQGGIPNVGIVSGGSVKTVRMEHVWVQAYVDFHPSRGALERQSSTWISLDASFKQYRTLPPAMDVLANVPVSRDEQQAALAVGAQIASDQGYVQYPNLAAVQNYTNAYGARVKEYIKSQADDPQPTAVFGARVIKSEQYPILLGTLPYKTIVVGQVMQALPDRLKWRFRTNIYAADGLNDPSSPIIEINQSTAQLVGKKITLGFSPASASDVDLLNSYLPKPHVDGSPILPSELPRTLPGYLLNMRAELRLDGKVVAQSPGSFTAGSSVRQSNSYFDPSSGSWSGGEDNDITVGDYNAIGLDLQGIGRWQLAEVQERVEKTKAKLLAFQLNPRDPTAIADISKEDITGDMLHSAVIGYFAQVDKGDAMLARQTGAVFTQRMPSYGRVASAVETQYWFGIPRSIRLGAIEVDIDHIAMNVTASDGDQELRRAFVRMSGNLASAEEHAVPETILRDPALAENDARQAQGVSAVKALVLAAKAGQKIYVLSGTNTALHQTVLAELRISQDVKNEIAVALDAGKEVVVHEANVTIDGWSGSGYQIIDPESGSGAYKIAGGANGGKAVPTAVGMAMGLAVGLAMTALLASAPFLGAAGVALIAVHIMAITMISILITAFLIEKETYSCFSGAFMAGFSFGTMNLALPKIMQVIYNAFGWYWVAGDQGAKCWGGA